MWSLHSNRTLIKAASISAVLWGWHALLCLRLLNWDFLNPSSCKLLHSAIPYTLHLICLYESNFIRNSFGEQAQWWSPQWAPGHRSMTELCVAHHQLSSDFCSSPSVAHTAGLLCSVWLHFTAPAVLGGHPMVLDLQNVGVTCCNCTFTSILSWSLSMEFSPATQCLAPVTPSYL